MDLLLLLRSEVAFLLLRSSAAGKDCELLVRCSLELIIREAPPILEVNPRALGNAGADGSPLRLLARLNTDFSGRLPASLPAAGRVWSLLPLLSSSTMVDPCDLADVVAAEGAGALVGEAAAAILGAAPPSPRSEKSTYAGNMVATRAFSAALAWV
tara:strand:- start:385 stop:852 length:468 start_codon:yes stop_codon:yes gene_type:complete